LIDIDATQAGASGRRRGAHMIRAFSATKLAKAVAVIS
jgi:hypothetical protein